VRPRALRTDKVYGPLLRRAIEVARQRSAVVAATRALETMEDADEVIVGIHAGTRESEGVADLLLVERGVRADVDPAKLVDADGRALWAAGPGGRVRELVRGRDEHGHPVDASLFELPGRTWVIVTGAARLQARAAFAHPFDRPPPDLEPEALAIVRIDGPSLVARIRALQDLGGLAAIGKHLKSLTLTLPPNASTAQGSSVRATLAYADEDAAAFAEVAMREVVAAIAHRAERAPARLAWLGSATVERPDKRVVVTAPLPPQLIDALLHADSVALPDADLPAPDTGSRP